MKKLLTVCPIPDDATSFYRGVGPLSTLQNHGKVELVYADKVDWTVMKHVDAVFMQRPHLIEFLQTLDLAKKFNKPVWVDYDDLLTALPDCSPVRYNYWREDVQNTIKTCLRNATIVTVSTQPLADAWKELASKFIVIPNAWDDDSYPTRTVLPKSAKPNILWRGAAGHDEDLFNVAADFKALARDNDYNWFFIGQPFWYTLRQVKEHCEPKVAAWTTLPDYFKLLQQVAPTVMLVPLTDSPFNRCKSNIAWIEATLAGAATVAPNWGEWLKPGITGYGLEKGPSVEIGSYFSEYRNSNFQDKVKEAIDFSQSKSSESWKYIESELRLSKVNLLREQALKEIGIL